MAVLGQREYTEKKEWNIYTGYPKTTNATDNNKRSWNQQDGIECKNLSGNNLPRIKLIRAKLFPDRYLLPILVAFVVLCRVGCLLITAVHLMGTKNW